MTILVTGGAGFIGSHLVEQLLLRGKAVHVVDDLSSAVWTPDDMAFLESSFPFTWEHGEVDNVHYAPGSTEAIYHLAAPVGPAGVLQYAGDIIRQISNATYAVIDEAVERECRLLYVSTSEVYGGGLNGLCSENMQCAIDMTKPSARLEYAIGKLAGEIAVMNTPGLNAVIVRPFNVAGPRQGTKGGFVLPRFVQQALANEPLTVFGDGKQVRAFTHVLDIASGLMLAMENGLKGRVYNLGAPGNRVTIEWLARRVLDLVHPDLTETRLDRVVHMLGTEVYGPAYREANDKYPDATRAIQELGWLPKRTIDQIAQSVIEYEKERANASV